MTQQYNTIQLSYQPWIEYRGMFFGVSILGKSQEFVQIGLELVKSNEISGVNVIINLSKPCSTNLSTFATARIQPNMQVFADFLMS